MWPYTAGGVCSGRLLLWIWVITGRECWKQKEHACSATSSVDKKSLKNKWRWCIPTALRSVIHLPVDVACLYCLIITIRIIMQPPDTAVQGVNHCLNTLPFNQLPFIQVLSLHQSAVFLDTVERKDLNQPFSDVTFARADREDIWLVSNTPQCKNKANMEKLYFRYLQYFHVGMSSWFYYLIYSKQKLLCVQFSCTTSSRMAIRWNQHLF